ncbi:MAG: nucleotidyltransferase family protein [Oscillibacter sp.]|nr:nucleotidyltransferase family protein [Oscillibacter sp.]
MKTAGMIIEYNPMHSGHAYLLEETRRRLGEDAAVVCAMSGDFVQRGGFAILRRQARARAAVESGADLVLELPLPWAVSSAEGFAQGGVSVLHATGLVDYLAFGSECGCGGTLDNLAVALLSGDFPPALKAALSKGVSFPAAREAAVAGLLSPAEAAVLRGPNDNLAVEYRKALLRMNSPIRTLAVRREGAPHDGEAPSGGRPSASHIRSLLRSGEREKALSLMTGPMAAAYLAEEAAGRAPVVMETCQRGILARLRSMEEAEFALLDGGREGLHRRLYRVSREAASLEAVLQEAKTKRFTHARLRRMVLRAYLGLTDTPGEVPYLRVLAANARGRELLARMRTTASLPVVTKPADVRRLGGSAQELFRLEARAADLYALAYPDLRAAAGGSLWRESPVMIQAAGR